jgi:cytochrome c peroxidase
MLVNGSGISKLALASLVSIAIGTGIVYSQELKHVSSYMPVDIKESFQEIYARLTALKPAVEAEHQALLAERYDLSNRTGNATMDRGKPVQTGVRVKLSPGTSWDQLSSLSPEEIKKRDLFPKGFLPLPHVKQSEGGMVFPQMEINEIKRQEGAIGRDLTRFDVDFDFPEHFIPEFPPAIFLTTRPDLGDVSQGKLVTNKNYYELFNGILNPKQLEGLRLLTTPFMQQQFNQTEDRRSVHPSQGVSCFDCHSNGHTNAAFHLVGDIRPQEFRHRIDTVSLRGVNIQRLFGSQRALKTVEDFTEFEQRAAYFDGDPVIATKKGVNILERASQVHFMAEFQEILAFPPAPKLDLYGRLDPTKATAQELRGQAIFLNKGQCVQCHSGQYYTDNSMHDLFAERFYKQHMENGMMMAHDGPIKTFTLRGIKSSPPYMHDGRLLTLDDTVEYFNLVLGIKLSAGEKQDLVAFLKAL